ncbi:MAG: 30S ribosomal protein S20 [Verrucomicrobiales bacterium]|nr:30S ribosomal protein S20 [Verrucomicrobiales bacterium]
MPNTKSAERRARVSARRQSRNRSVKSRLGTLERKYRALVTAGKKDEAAQALRAATSALDKAAKRGVIPKGRADRKKSRLSLSLKRVAASASTKPAA